MGLGKTIGVFLSGVAFSAGVFYLAEGLSGSIRRALFGVQKANGYGGISLGMSMDGVLYVVGFPDDLYKKSKIVWDDKTASDAYDKVNDARSAEAKAFYVWGWNYDDKKRAVMVNFDETSKVVNRILCRDASGRGLCAIDGLIKTGDREENIFSVLGKEDNSELSYGTLTLTYKKYNLELYLERKTLVGLAVNEIN